MTHSEEVNRSMPVLERKARLSIYLANADTRHHRTVSGEILHRAHRAGLAGATTVQGIEGFGHSGTVHGTPRWHVTDRTPITVHIIDLPERIEAFLPQLADLVGQCMIVCDVVDVMPGDGAQPSKRSPARDGGRVARPLDSRNRKRGRRDVENMETDRPGRHDRHSLRWVLTGSDPLPKKSPGTVRNAVVVGCDGKPDSDSALRFAAQEAELRAAPLVVVTAFFRPIDPDIDSFDTPDSELRAQAHETAETALARALCRTESRLSFHSWRTSWASA